MSRPSATAIVNAKAALVIYAAAQLPCNGDGRRRPCGSRMKYKCPWCTARELVDAGRKVLRP